MVGTKETTRFTIGVDVSCSDGVTGEVRLACTLAHFEELEAAEETQFLPGTPYPGYDPRHVDSWPYFGMIGAVRGGTGLGIGDISDPVTIESCPWARWPCAAANQSLPTTGTSARSRGSSWSCRA